MPDAAERDLARLILEDRELVEVLDRARALIKTGFTAGSIYGEIWIRDFATFMEIACQMQDRAVIRNNLLMFCRFQGDDGNIVDGFTPRDEVNRAYDYIENTNVPDFLAHKNTVETDQEASLVHGVTRYVEGTGDREILDVNIDGRTVLERLEWALEYLLAHRCSEKYGLLWGGTTADWGDVQPEHEWGVFLDGNSHRAINIYNNAMFVLAVQNFIALLDDDAERVERWSAIEESFRANVRKHLWDEERQKFIPHVYLDGSPFPDDFDESVIYYHGGTAMAIAAGLLEQREIVSALEKMVENVRAAGAQSIGLTMYPAYPDGFFKNPLLRTPYTYQNGGDWTWFGGRMIQQLVRHGMVAEAYCEVRPMVKRVIENNGFFEWWSLDGKPSGSGAYRGSAGVLGWAIQMMREWADQ